VGPASSQKWNAQRYSENARFVSDLGMPVVDLLAPLPGERILDLGCGDGALTKKLVDGGCDVVGVDSSAEMIAAAKTLGLDARVMDGHALQFDDEFDAVFSNAVLHWLKEPWRVVDGVWRALKPGGRFVGEFGGYGNVATILASLERALRERGIDPGTVNPWYNPTADEYRDILAMRGFAVSTIALIPRWTPLPGTVVAWLETFAQSFASALPVSERPAFFDEVQESCRPILCGAGGRWHADYLRLRFAATKPRSTL
jgi:trans-aconitate methyltransferase